MRLKVLTVVQMVTLVSQGEDEGCMFTQNNGIYLQVRIMSQATTSKMTTVIIA
jgi:hypothetical protein